MRSVIIGVEGMSCQSCVNSVTSAVKAVEGVSAVEVSLADRHARVTFDEKADVEKIAQAIEDAGFEAKVGA